MGIAKRGYITRIIEVVLFAPVGTACAVVPLLQFAQGLKIIVANAARVRSIVGYEGGQARQEIVAIARLEVVGQYGRPGQAIFGKMRFRG